jgi:hypothetical protein
VIESVPRWLAGTTVILVGDDVLRLPVSDDRQVSIQVEEGSDDTVTFVGQWTAPPLFTGSTAPIPLMNLAAAAAAPRSGLLRCQPTPGGVEIRMTVYLEGLSRHDFLDALGEVGRSYEFLVSAAHEFESQLQLFQDVRGGPRESGVGALPAPPAPPTPSVPPTGAPPSPPTVQQPPTTPPPPPFRPPQAAPPPGPPPFQPPQPAPPPSFPPPPAAPPTPYQPPQSPPQSPPYQPPQSPPYQAPQAPRPPAGPPPAPPPPPQPPAGGGWAASHRIAPGGADARDAPDPARPVVVHLPDGMDVSVLERRYGWAHVAAQSGWTGWIAEYGVIARA